VSALVLPLVQRPPTRWADHLVATAVMLVVLVGIYLLMWRGWRRRAARQADLPPLPPVPDPPPRILETLDGVYLGTTRAGEWLERIVARGLGERATARLGLSAAGVVVERDGRDPFLVPLAALRAARLDRGIANTVVGAGTVVVLTWEHGGRLLDIGVRGPSPEANARWVAGVDAVRAGGAGERTP
jgi:hypothetical protein